MSKFDKLFAESFYTGEWFEGVTQEAILKSVKCPIVYLNAKTKYGIVVRSGHDIHYEKPRYFLRAIKELEKTI